MLPPTPPRRFTLLDAMVLIAATALGTRGVHVLWSTLNVSHLATPFDENRGLWALVRLPHLLSALVPLVAAWTIAVAVLGLAVSPRPRGRRRLAIQPGLAACVAATVGLAITALRSLLVPGVQLASFGEPMSKLAALVRWDTVGLFLIAQPFGVGIAVAAVWTCLVVGRRWRAEPTWIDCLGRALGAYWLLMIVWIHALEALMLTRVVTLAPLV